MASIGSVSGVIPNAIQNAYGPSAPGGLQGVGNGLKLGNAEGIKPAGGDFGNFLGEVMDTVQATQLKAQEATRQVLTGESDQLHQSMIAMQESGVAFTLMVEVRNRLVESYQELMRMPV